MTFGSSFSSLWSLTPLLFPLVRLCLYDFHIFLPSICYPIPPTTTSFLICLILLFWQFCITLSFPLSSLTNSENSGVPLFETFCWVFSWSQLIFTEMLYAHCCLHRQTDCWLNLLSEQDLWWVFSKREEDQREHILWVWKQSLMCVWMQFKSGACGNAI